MPPVGNDDASGSPWISSLPENSAIAVPSPAGAVEGVVLLGRRAGQRLEPVRVVGRALLHRPLLHRQRDRVGQRGVERLAARERALQRLVDVLGQPVALDGGGEHVRAEDLVARRRSGRASRARLRWRLHCAAVTLCWRVLWHERDRFLLEKWASGDPGRSTRETGNRSAKIGRERHHRLAKSPGRSFRQRAKRRVARRRATGVGRAGCPGTTSPVFGSTCRGRRRRGDLRR